VDRFLVADEVGLGKTLVAKGVIACAIEKLQRTPGSSRIDVVYICSNAGHRPSEPRTAEPDRAHRAQLQRTPDDAAARSQLRRTRSTSSPSPRDLVQPASAEGKASERVLLYHLLRRCWGNGVVGSGKPDKRVFQGWSGFDRFKSSSEVRVRMTRRAAGREFEEALGRRGGSRQSPRGDASFEERYGASGRPQLAAEGLASA
jgi:hypothetical protein